MSVDALLTLAALGGALFLMVRNLVVPALAVFGADVFLLVVGVLTPEDAFSGFANPAPFTVAALYLVARAVEKTGGLRSLVAGMLGRGRRRDGRSRLGRMLMGVAGASAFLNNTPIVAMLAPEVSTWAERRGRAPSRYLMPLSFAAILGGMVTVIGTSTTIVVSGLLEATGQPPLAMFEITALGLPLAVGGILLLRLLPAGLLPDRTPPHTEFERGGRTFTTHLTVADGGPLDGRRLGESELSALRGVNIPRLDREAEVVAPVTGETVLRGGDRLTALGPADLVAGLQRLPGLRPAGWRHGSDLQDAEHGFFEVVVGAASPVLGETLSEARFREQYGAAVLALHRAGESVPGPLADVQLRVGDTLLLLGGPGFQERWRHRRDFLVIYELEGHRRLNRHQAYLAGATVLGVVGLAASGVLPILEAALLGAATVVGTGLLTMREAGRAVDLNVVMLIASAFGLGRALEVTGLADAAANGLVGAFEGFGVAGVLVGLILATVVLTELVTNNASAVIVFPVALGIAADTGMDPRALALVVAIAASASFLTPIGYQTNTMVYGPGGYRFTDYVRVGFPLTLMVLVLLPVLVLLFYGV